jgi:hypothetical protein
MACSTNGGDEECIYDAGYDVRYWWGSQKERDHWESQKERDHWEYQDVGGWTILKLIFER